MMKIDGQLIYFDATNLEISKIKKQNRGLKGQILQFYLSKTHISCFKYIISIPY